MSDAEEEQSEQDLTMEEILSSIRKIISEEDAGEVEEAPDEAEAVPEEPEPEPEPEEAAAEPEPEVEPEAELEVEEEEDILELTDVVEDVELEDIELGDEEPAADAEAFPKDEGLLSPDAAQRTSVIIDQLASTLTSGYDGDGRTLEGLVKAMLRPLLKEWLDANLPEMVQRAVEAEIARLTRYNK